MPRGIPAMVTEEELKNNPEAGRSGTQRLREPRYTLRGDETAQQAAFRIGQELVNAVLTDEGQTFFNWRKAAYYKIEYTLGVERDRETPPASITDELQYDEAINLFEAMGAIMKREFNAGRVEHYYVELDAYDEKGRKHVVTRHRDDRRKMRF